VNFLIPTLNEEKNIAKVLEKVKACAFTNEIFVIDGNSTDATCKIVQSYSVHLINQKSKGKGGAISEALHILPSEFPVILIDGDGTYDPADSLKILPLLHPGTLINGSRFLGKLHPGSMNSLNLLGNKFLNFMFNLLHSSSIHISDFMSGMKGFYVQDLQNLHLQSYNFEIETEIMLKAIKKLQIQEVPIDYYPRGGQSKLHPIRDGYRIFRRLLSAKFHKN
jgi:dolichol-phosphate mannosyltransferase